MASVMTFERRAARFLLAITLSCAVGVMHEARSQDKRDHPDADAQQLARRCNPVIVRKPKLKRRSIQFREGEKSTGYPPNIAFQVAASGEVLNAHVKRSSGIRDVDNSALSFIQSWRYNSRPGCPVIDSEAVVLIQLM
jgi:TonB family protein